MYEHNRRRRSYVMKETPEEAKSNINAEAQIEESNKLLFNNLDDSLLDERQILRPGNSEGSHFFHSEKGMVGSTKSEFPTGQYNSDRIRGFDLKWRGIDIKCSGENVSLGKQAEPLKPSVGQVSSAPFQQNLKRDKSRLSAPNYLGDAQHRTNESSDRLKYSISILKDKPNPEMLFGSSSSGVDLNFQRISLKLFGCNPENLAPMVYKELNELIQRFPGQVEEYVRPGCIHLILDVCAPELWGWTVIQSFAQMTASIFKNHLTMEDHFLLSDGHKYWKSTIQNLQKGLCHFEGNNCQPLLSSISPSCIILSKRRTCFSLKMSNVNENIKVYFRQSGKVFDCLILERKEDTILFEMQTNKALKIGRAEIEVEDDNTGILSNSLPVIIAPNNALGNYVSKELKNPLISSHLISLLRESGYILQWADSSRNKCFTNDLMLHLIHRCANDASSLGYFGLSKLIQNCRKSILHSTVK